MRKKTRKPKTRKPTYGRVSFRFEYVVRLRDPAMVERAKQALLDDVAAAMNYEEMYDNIQVLPDPGARAEYIPEFLREAEDG